MYINNVIVKIVFLLICLSVNLSRTVVHRAQRERFTSIEWPLWNTLVTRRLIRNIASQYSTSSMKLWNHVRLVRKHSITGMSDVTHKAIVFNIFWSKICLNSVRVWNVCRVQLLKYFATRPHWRQVHTVKRTDCETFFKTNFESINSTFF